MAYNKKSVAMYAFYEIISSYFNSCKTTNKFVESNLRCHFMDSGNDFQYACEDFAIYSVENIFPKYVGDYDLSKYDAIIMFNKETYIITIKTSDFSFEVAVGYEEKIRKPTLKYQNIRIREGEQFIPVSEKKES